MQEPGDSHDARKVTHGTVAIEQCGEALLRILELIKREVPDQPVSVPTGRGGLYDDVRAQPRLENWRKRCTIKIHKQRPHTHDVASSTPLAVASIDHDKDSRTGIIEPPQVIAVRIKVSMKDTH